MIFAQEMAGDPAEVESQLILGGDAFVRELRMLKLPVSSKSAIIGSDKTSVANLKYHFFAKWGI